MNTIDRIMLKIEKAQKLLNDVRKELDFLKNKVNLSKKKQKQPSDLPTEEELRSEYNRLYSEFVHLNDKKIVHDFVSEKNKTYLKAFCKANSIPVDVKKVSKNKIAEVIINWFVQRKAITKKAI